MNLLVITQSVGKNDENLGAFYYWWEEMARRVDHLTIIASAVGVHHLPSNVSVYSLGKEDGRGRLGRIWRFWELFSRHYAECDAVLFHQIPEFVIAASPFIMSLRKPAVLWYAHKSVTRHLRIAERLVDWVATSSPEGFRLPSKKAIYVGQAINTDLFQPVERPGSADDAAKPLRIISVGRISPVKHYETLLRACTIGLHRWAWPWRLTIVGGPLAPGDLAYKEELERIVAECGLVPYVEFVGSKVYEEIPIFLQSHDIFVNLSATGSLDKAVFEAMACGLSVITSNEAYRDILPARYFLSHAAPEELARQIGKLADEKRPNQKLREIVVRRHSLRETVGRIMGLLAA